MKFFMFIICLFSWSLLVIRTSRLILIGRFTVKLKKRAILWRIEKVLFMKEHVGPVRPNIHEFSVPNPDCIIHWNNPIDLFTLRSSFESNLTFTFQEVITVPSGESCYLDFSSSKTRSWYARQFSLSKYEVSLNVWSLLWFYLTALLAKSYWTLFKWFLSLFWFTKQFSVS